jgi:hypothetical protein
MLRSIFWTNLLSKLLAPCLAFRRGLLGRGRLNVRRIDRLIIDLFRLVTQRVFDRTSLYLPHMPVFRETRTTDDEFCHVQSPSLVDNTT